MTLSEDENERQWNKQLPFSFALACRFAKYTAQRGSGRIGRSEAGRNLDQKALRLAVGASVRHSHTNYDELLARGVDRADARRLIAPKVEGILAVWETR